MPKVPDTFSQALAAVTKLESSTVASDRLKAARLITGNSIDIDDIPTRDKFGAYALQQIKAWKKGGSIRILSNYLIVALAEPSDFLEESSSVALQAIADGSFDSEDLATQNDADVIVDTVLQYFKETYATDIDLYPLQQMVVCAQGLAPTTKLKAVRVLLEGLKYSSQQKRLKIRQAIEALFYYDSQQRVLPSSLREVAERLIGYFPVEKWATWLPDLSFAADDTHKFAHSCRQFLTCCFDPSHPALLLYFHTGKAPGCERTLLLKANDIQAARDEREVRRIAERLGQELRLTTQDNNFLEDNFLDREVNAFEVSRAWISQQIEINKKNSNNVLPFHIRKRKQ